MRTSLLLLALAATAGCASRKTEGGPRSAPAEIRDDLARGDRSRRTGDPAQALESYAKAVEERPDSVPAHLRYVASLLALGRASEAKSVYAARAAGPAATEADRTMAERLATNGSSSHLRRVYAAAAGRNPANPWWRLALAEVEIAEADAWNRRRNEASDRGDREAEKEALAQARAALRRGSRSVEEAAEAAPRMPEVDLYRGYLRAVEGDTQAGATARAAAYRAAAEAFSAAVIADPGLVEGWIGLGDARYRTGDSRGALEAWLEGAKRSPSDPYLRESVGMVLHEADRHEEAVEQYLEAARLEPKDAEPMIRVGDARADAGKWEAAIEAYDEALRRDPRALDAHYKRGLVFERMGRLAEARLAYERYVAEGGEKASQAQRKIERLVTSERCPR